jgi:hypothetical protein
LSKNQRFAEADRWFRFIFDPMNNDTVVDPSQRPWKFVAFRTIGPAERIEELLLALAKPLDECTPAENGRKRRSSPATNRSRSIPSSRTASQRPAPWPTSTAWS